MYAFPIDDWTAFAVSFEGLTPPDPDEDGAPFEEAPEPTIWRHHFIDFAEGSVVSFRTPSGGYVYSATLNSKTGAVWMLARNKLFILSRKERKVYEGTLPEKGLAIFNVTEIGDRFYFACDFGKVWCYDGPAGAWIPVLTADPPPARSPRREGETAEQYVERTTPARQAYIERFPRVYSAFAVGKEHYFVGALGRVVRQRADRFDEVRIESGARLVWGYAENDAAILWGDAPTAEVFRGTMDDGFERIFQSDDKALHMTAMHGGVRYIGAAVYPGLVGPSLYTLRDGELTAVETGCAREPDNLIQLVSTGNVLWAIDEKGFFRLTPEGWVLDEIAELAPQD